MEPKQDIKKLLKVNFNNTESYYDIKTKLVTLEQIICHSLDQNVIEGAFMKILSLFITRNKVIKRACIPHFKKIKRHVKNISQDITNLFYINDRDVILLTLKFVRIFAKFYCRNNIVIYHVLHSKNKYKYKVLNSLISRNNDLLGLFDYQEIIQNEFAEDNKEDDNVKRLKLSQEHPQKSINFTNSYIKTIETLKQHFLNQNRKDIIEFMKVGEFDQIKNEDTVKRLFFETKDSSCENQDKSLSCVSKFTEKMTKDDFKNELNILKTISSDYKTAIICSYFSDLIEKSNESTSKHVFEIKNGEISPSFVVKFYDLVNDRKFTEIERIFTKLFVCD
jgi:hypothetical protein